MSLPVRRARVHRTLDLGRCCGIAVTALAGPLAGVIAWLAFGMGALEVGALVFLISGWLGPRLMGLSGL